MCVKYSLVHCVVFTVFIVFSVFHVFYVIFFTIPSILQLHIIIQLLKTLSVNIMQIHRLVVMDFTKIESQHSNDPSKDTSDVEVLIVVRDSTSVGEFWDLYIWHDI